MSTDTSDAAPREEALADGTRVTVRPIAADDRERLDAFHERCSDRTHYLRFFGSKPHLRPAMLDRFVNVDHAKRDALVALLDDEIIAVARYDRVGEDVGDRVAEVAFVVGDRYQGHGLATLLLDLLADLARSRGIAVFRAQTLAENAAMQSVFRHSRFDAHPHRRVDDASVIEFTFSIADAP